MAIKKILLLVLPIFFLIPLLFLGKNEDVRGRAKEEKKQKLSLAKQPLISKEKVSRKPLQIKSKGEEHKNLDNKRKRKGIIQLVFRDEAGNPVPGVPVVLLPKKRCNIGWKLHLKEDEIRKSNINGIVRFSVPPGKYRWGYLGKYSCGISPTSDNHILHGLSGEIEITPNSFSEFTSIIYNKTKVTGYVITSIKADWLRLELGYQIGLIAFMTQKVEEINNPSNSQYFEFNDCITGNQSLNIVAYNKELNRYSFRELRFKLEPGEDKFLGEVNVPGKDYKVLKCRITTTPIFTCEGNHFWVRRVYEKENINNISIILKNVPIGKYFELELPIGKYGFMISLSYQGVNNVNRRYYCDLAKIGDKLDINIKLPKEVYEKRYTFYLIAESKELFHGDVEVFFLSSQKKRSRSFSFGAYRNKFLVAKMDLPEGRYKYLAYGSNKNFYSMGTFEVKAGIKESFKKISFKQGVVLRAKVFKNGKPCPDFAISFDIDVFTNVYCAITKGDGSFVVYGLPKGIEIECRANKRRFFAEDCDFLRIDL